MAPKYIITLDYKTEVSNSLDSFDSKATNLLEVLAEVEEIMKDRDDLYEVLISEKYGTAKRENGITTTTYRQIVENMGRGAKVREDNGMHLERNTMRGADKAWFEWRLNR